MVRTPTWQLPLPVGRGQLWLMLILESTTDAGCDRNEVHSQRFIAGSGLRSMIQAAGIAEHDPRIAHTMEQVKLLEATKAADAHLTLEEFSEIVRPDLRMMCVPAIRS